MLWIHIATAIGTDNQAFNIYMEPSDDSDSEVKADGNSPHIQAAHMTTIDNPVASPQSGIGPFNRRWHPITIDRQTRFDPR